MLNYGWDPIVTLVCANYWKGIFWNLEFKSIVGTFAKMKNRRKQLV